MKPRSPIHIHRLLGCRPKPLAHYLKALGVLRLVAEQIDSKARGWWQDDVFHLSTTLDREALEDFFLSKYVPTPMLAPWLPRSGFSNDSSHSKTREWLTRIFEANDKRFNEFRQCHAQFVQFAELFGLDLSEPDCMRTTQFINFARVRVAPSTRLWIDTCSLPIDDRISYPAIFGTGGNEGSGSYLANYYQALAVSLIVKEDNLPFALFNEKIVATPIPSKNRHNAGHYSESTGIDSPWTYVLAIEGSLLLASSISRRMDLSRQNSAAGTAASLASPFTVANDCVGYASSSVVDSKSNRQGKLVPGRGEQWMPIWTSPTRMIELKQMFREGRSGLRRRPASRSRDFWMAISRSGVARGISEFERYGYVQRNGDNHMAIPLGRFKVQTRPNQRLLDEVAPWIDRLRQIASDKLAPQSIARAYRACELAVFNCAKRAAGSDFLQLLVTLGEAEDQMVASPKFSADKCSPMPRLAGQWLSVIADDYKDRVEFRLAVALASQHGPLETNARWTTIRNHWLPLEKLETRFDKGEQGLNITPEQAAIGLDFTRASLAVLNRRLLALNRGVSESYVPLKPIRFRFAANLADIQRFMNYKTDDAQILAYARGLMSIRFEDDVANVALKRRDSTPLGGLAIFGVLRLALPVGEIELLNGKRVSIRCNSTVFRRLQNGDLSGAFQLAVRQLTNVSLRPKLLLATGTPELSRRLAASMIFGVAPHEWTRMALALTDPHFVPDANEKTETGIESFT
jgi:CRISPR-associated protein Csx17